MATSCGAPLPSHPSELLTHVSFPFTLFFSLQIAFNCHNTDALQIVATAIYAIVEDRDSSTDIIPAPHAYPPSGSSTNQDGSGEANVDTTDPGHAHFIKILQTKRAWEVMILVLFDDRLQAHFIFEVV